jgi:hypothetical protein
MKIPYFVYGGRADAAHSILDKKLHPLTSDWDIIINDRNQNVNEIINYMLDFIQSKVDNRFKNIGKLYVKHFLISERNTIQLIDPYMPYEKKYNIMDIFGCHETEGDPDYKDWCDLFDTVIEIEGIMYVSKNFNIQETERMAKGKRKIQMERDKEDVTNSIKIVEKANNDLNNEFVKKNGEQKDIDEIIDSVTDYFDALENKEDLIDKYISSYVKLKRTETRLKN